MPDDLTKVLDQLEESAHRNGGFRTAITSTNTLLALVRVARAARGIGRLENAHRRCCSCTFCDLHRELHAALSALAHGG